jgi:hypothetical protein
MLPSASRFGFQYYPDDRHYGPADLAAWLPVLRSFGAAWLVLRASTSRSVPEDFLRGLLDEGIEPIVHLPAPVGRLNPSDVEPLLRAYTAWGVRHVVLFDKPNLRSSWESSEWSRVGIVERFIDRALPLWNLQAELGMVPMVSPLEPGGDYWDTAFLEGTLRGLARRGQESLLDRLALGAYTWTYGRALDWGAGGPQAWPESRPYHTPEGSQDQRGLRLPEWYTAIGQTAIGKALPVYVIGGGALPARTTTDDGSSFEQNAGVARWLMGPDAPATLQSFAFFLLTASPTSSEAYAAWYSAPDQPKRDVDMVRGALLAAAKTQRPKSLAHYILLPPGSADPMLWALAGQVALRTPGAVGCSPAEARLAERVTVLGTIGSIDEQTTAHLERDGCRVEWLDPDTFAAAARA